MKNKHVGLMVIGIALILFFVVISYNLALKQIVDATCTHGESCTMHITIRNQEIVSYSLMGLLVLVGLFITFFMKEDLKLYKKESHFSKEELNKKMESLEDEEKKVMQIVLGKEGSAYQSDIIKEMNLSKVKVSRLLDRLEGKGLIERKRRGMTNIVIVK